mgnify:CR=1 FL=1
MTKRNVWLTVFAVVLLGCGPAGERAGGVMQDPTLGVSLQAPSGWRVQSASPDMASKGDSTGLILEERMLGRSFEEVVDALTSEFGAELLSRAPRTINGHDAVEAIIHYPQGGSKALKMYIHKEPSVIEVSFVTPVEAFDSEEAALRQALGTIAIR